MDGDAAIEHNRQALMRVVASLVAMAGLGETSASLPRFLRNAVLRLVRPAEAAARRLAIALGCRIAITLPARRERSAVPEASTVVTSASATGIVMPRGLPRPATAIRRLPLPLLDPLPRPFAERRPLVPVRSAPRISTPGFGKPWQPPPALSDDDAVAARRLRLRLEGLERALCDLEAEALRFARWQARQRRARLDASRRRSRSHSCLYRQPLRHRPPPSPHGRRRHAVHDILDHAHSLAVFALETRDTS